MDGYGNEAMMMDVDMSKDMEVKITEVTWKYKSSIRSSMAFLFFSNAIVLPGRQ